MVISCTLFLRCTICILLYMFSSRWLLDRIYILHGARISNPKLHVLLTAAQLYTQYSINTRVIIAPLWFYNKRRPRPVVYTYVTIISFWIWCPFSFKHAAEMYLCVCINWNNLLMCIKSLNVPVLDKSICNNEYRKYDTPYLKIRTHLIWKYVHTFFKEKQQKNMYNNQSLNTTERQQYICTEMVLITNA